MPRSSKDTTANSTNVSENTPLLGSSTDELTISSNEGRTMPKNGDHNNKKPQPSHHDDDKPLPKLQIFLLCFARLIDPMAFFGIFPFVNSMIYENGIEKKDVGFYSGMIESLFSLTQMMLMISWGRASDRIGRKPVLVFSLAGVSIATTIFGFSKTIWQMVLFRCCAGVFAGTIVTIRTMLSENSTPKTQARAFSFFAFTGNIGIFLGSFVGGALADPTHNIGGLFKKIQFFHTYPYALPTMTTGTIGAIVAVSCGLFIKETLKRKVEGDESNAVPPPMTTWELLNAPGVAIVLALYGHIMLLALGYTAVCPVFYFEPPHLGGYGFTPAQIAIFMCGVGISQALWLLLAFPPLQKKYGTGAILKGCYIAWPIFFAAAPMCNLFLRWGGKWEMVFWVVAPVLQIGGSGVAMAFTAIQLALNDIAPTPATLGTLNALALTLVSFIRTIGPALFTSIFAAGVRSQFINGYLIWLILILIALVGSIGIRWLPEKAEGKLLDRED